jgi:sec-independent protein translocase protein TatB
MFDVGFWELVVLFGLGLMVLGPERMPKVASQLGRWAAQARRMARNLSSQLQDEIEPLQSSLKSADETLRKDFSKMRPEFGQEAERGSTPGVRPEFGQEAERGSTPDVVNEHGDAGDDIAATPATTDKQPAAGEPAPARNKPS